jgi:epoxide hydrolase
MSDLERERFSYFQRGESSYFNLQASEPQTLAYALTDSPVGWLAWMIDKFQMLIHDNGDFLTVVDRDTFLTDVTLYWVTGTVGSAMRILSRESAIWRGIRATPASGNSCGTRGFSRGSICQSTELDQPDL